VYGHRARYVVSYVDQTYGVSYGELFRFRYRNVSHAFLRSSIVEDMRAQQQLGVSGRSKTVKKETKNQQKGENKRKESQSRREYVSTRAIRGVR
jgi:hypothetical protein